MWESSLKVLQLEVLTSLQCGPSCLALFMPLLGLSKSTSYSLCVLRHIPKVSGGGICVVVSLINYAFVI